MMTGQVSDKNNEPIRQSVDVLLVTEYGYHIFPRGSNTNFVFTNDN